MNPRHYATPLAFKQALDERLREATRGGNQFSRKRQILVFERFLARVAEKLHAYTMPRIHPNSRVKDFPDLALLASVRNIDARVLKAALDLTFSFRKTHVLPTTTPLPSSEWTAPYSNMAREDRLEWPNLESLTTAVQSFLDPILAGDLDAILVPKEWKWLQEVARRGDQASTVLLSGLSP